MSMRVAAAYCAVMLAAVALWAFRALPGLLAVAVMVAATVVFAVAAWLGLTARDQGRHFAAGGPSEDMLALIQAPGTKNSHEALSKDETDEHRDNRLVGWLSRVWRDSADQPTVEIAPQTDEQPVPQTAKPAKAEPTNVEPVAPPIGDVVARNRGDQ